MLQRNHTVTGNKTETLTGQRKASFWRRLAAVLSDAVLIGTVGIMVKFTFGFDDTIPPSFDFFFFYGYNIFMDYYFGGSVGKLLFKLRVISANRKKLRFWNAFCRNIGRQVSSLPLMYGYLRILADHHQQTIHDELAQCYVVEIFQHPESEALDVAVSGQ